MAGSESCLDSFPRSGRAGRQEPAAAPDERGITLIEMIVVMIIVAILAVAVIPRFASRSDFDARGFHDGTLSLLRYAQKSAVAQRRNVCVGFGASTVSLTIASAFGGACDTPLTGPNGVAPYALTAPSGVAFTALPANFIFLSSGAASLGQTFGVTNYPGKTITIVAATGYVQEN